MFEDFDYITDEKFLENYWSEEKVICPSCQGTGKSPLLQDKKAILTCPVCRGLGMIKRSEQQKLVKFP